MVSLLPEDINITDKQSWYRWYLKNHPDRGGDHEVFCAVKAEYENMVVLAHGQRCNQLINGRMYSSNLLPASPLNDST